MRHDGILLSIAFLAVVAVWGGTAAASGPGELEELAKLPRIITPEDCGFCRNCEDPGKHEFENDDAGPDRAYGEDNHECDTPNWSAGSCPSRHPESLYCQWVAPAPVAQLDPQGKQRLWELLVLNEGRDADLPAELGQLGEAVVFNASRGAVQVHGGCDGSLITMSIPLNTAQIAELDGFDNLAR